MKIFRKGGGGGEGSGDIARTRKKSFGRINIGRYPRKAVITKGYPTQYTKSKNVKNTNEVKMERHACDKRRS